MDYKKVYEEWLNSPYFDEETKAELRGIARDENEIRERFYAELEFGTAGLRGIIGAGTNRMNVYTVRKATQGLANYIAKVNGQSRGVAIAYDSRHMSPEFADVAALCLAANGIKAYVFESLKAHAGAFLRSPPASLHRRYQHHRQPQPAGVQRLQGLLGGWRADHTASRHRHHG